MLQFLHQCSICSPCCGTTHSSRRRHSPMARSMKRCNSFLTQWRLPAWADWLSWIVDADRPSVKGHPKQRNRLDSSPVCLGATCEARGTWRSHAAGTSMCSWLCVTARRPAADIRARCQRYSSYRMSQLLWTITETINTLFLVVNLLTCIMCFVTEVALFSIVAFKTLDISQGSVATHLRFDEIFSNILLQIYSWFWQWNNFENRLIFDEVKAYKKLCHFWATLYMGITRFYSIDSNSGFLWCRSLATL